MLNEEYNYIPHPLQTDSIPSPTYDTTISSHISIFEFVVVISHPSAPVRSVLTSPPVDISTYFCLGGFRYRAAPHTRRNSKSRDLLTRMDSRSSRSGDIIDVVSRGRTRMRGGRRWRWGADVYSERHVKEFLRHALYEAAQSKLVSPVRGNAAGSVVRAR